MTITMGRIEEVIKASAVGYIYTKRCGSLEQGS
jgi:hypothetical protein